MPKIIEKTETPVVEPATEVDPTGVHINCTNFQWRDVLVRMPEGMIADDLRSPKIWKRVQSSRHTALIKLDHLFVLGHDESWAVRAVVTHANSSEAHLAIEKVFTFRAQGQSLWKDGTLEVFWDGGAYGVRRMADGVRIISEGYTTEPQAIAAAQRWYPKAVA